MHPFVVPGVRNNANQWIMIPFYSLSPPSFPRADPQNAHAAKVEIRSTGPTGTPIKETPSRNQKEIPPLCKKRVENAMTIEIGNSFAHMPFKKAFTTLHPAMQRQHNPNLRRVFSPLLLIFSFPFPLW